MARTAITPQRVAVDGTALATEPANVDGNSVLLDARRALFVNNASAGAINVTIPTTATLEGLTVGSRVVAVPAGAARYIRPSSTAAQSGGVVHVDYSAVTSVTVAVLEI
jgi:hypothetical protein